MVLLFRLNQGSRMILISLLINEWENLIVETSFLYDLKCSKRESVTNTVIFNQKKVGIVQMIMLFLCKTFWITNFYPKTIIHSAL